LNGKPALRPGCRLSDSAGQADMLLIPEGALRLKGTSLKIVELCDGQRSIADIVSELQALYPSAPPDQIAEHVAEFLERLRAKSVVEF
jgi:pyrroloquinoline quinone biosynthesis protein D